MAPMVPLSTDDGRGGSQGLLWDRRTGRLTVVIRVSPVGLDLADRGPGRRLGRRRSAASWPTWATSRWSATSRSPSTPRRPAAPPCATTSPAGSTRPRPAAARAVLGELVDATPATSADVDTRVSVTFDPARANPRPTDLVPRWPR